MRRSFNCISCINVLTRGSIAASCAAPFYFEPVDNLHDGAFGGGNNPSSIIAGELHQLSMLPIPHMDFEASFGTGSFVEECPTHWLQRLKRGLEQGFSASALYGRYLMTLSTSGRERSYRIDPFFERTPVSLDDVSSMESMKEQTQERLSTEYEPLGEENRAGSQMSSTIENLRIALVATLFYGVLLSPPSFDPSSGQYSVELAVVSRWEDMESIKSELSEVLESSYFLIERTRHQFTTPLLHSVKVASLQRPLDIQLSYNLRSHSISGFPISISDMIYLQGPKSLSVDHNQGLSDGKRCPPDETERISPSSKRPRRTR